MTGLLDYVPPVSVDSGKLFNIGPTPTLTATGLGTGGTQSIIGGPIAGLITINAGLVPVAAGVLTVTFATPLSVLPTAIHITPATGANVGVGWVKAFLDRFEISGLTVLSSTSYSYYYTVVMP